MPASYPYPLTSSSSSSSLFLPFFSSDRPPRPTLIPAIFPKFKFDKAHYFPDKIEQLLFNPRLDLHGPRRRRRERNPPYNSSLIPSPMHPNPIRPQHYRTAGPTDGGQKLPLTTTTTTKHLERSTSTLSSNPGQLFAVCPPQNCNACEKTMETKNTIRKDTN